MADTSLKRKKMPTATRTGVFVERPVMFGPQVSAVMAAVSKAGLLTAKTGRIGGRISETLVERAKENTGITSDTDLIEFAIANLAVEDRFSEAFKAVRATVDPDIKIGF